MSRGPGCQRLAVWWRDRIDAGDLEVAGEHCACGRRVADPCEAACHILDHGHAAPSVVMPNAYWSPGSNRALRPSVGCSTVAHFVNRRAEGLKHGVGAMRMPVDTRLSNWAYMVMTARGLSGR